MLSFMWNILLPPPTTTTTLYGPLWRPQPHEHIGGFPYQASCVQQFFAVGLIGSCSWEYPEEQSSSIQEVDVEPRSTQFQRIRGFFHDCWRNNRSSPFSNSFTIRYWETKDRQDHCWKINNHKVIFSFLPFYLYARIRSYFGSFLQDWSSTKLGMDIAPCRTGSRAVQISQYFKFAKPCVDRKTIRKDIIGKYFVFNCYLKVWFQYMHVIKNCYNHIK